MNYDALDLIARILSNWLRNK